MATGVVAGRLGRLGWERRALSAFASFATSALPHDFRMTSAFLPPSRAVSRRGPGTERSRPTDLLASHSLGVATGRARG